MFFLYQVFRVGSDRNYFSPKYRLICGLILSVALTQVCNAQTRSLSFESCTDGAAIESAYVFHGETGKVLGYTNAQGKASLFESVFDWPLSLRIYKMSALDTLLHVDQKTTRICLNEKSHRLTTVDITSPKEDIAETFRKYLEHNIRILRSVDTVHHYSFEWMFMLPDSNWSMQLKGTIKMEFNAYSKVYSGACGGHFCTIDLTIDSAFYHSDFLKDNNLVYVSTFFLSFDALRKGGRLRKKIKDESVLMKMNSLNGIEFVYSVPVRKNWKSRCNIEFDRDSILISNVMHYQDLDPSMKQSKDIVYLDDQIGVGYMLFGNEIILSSMELNQKLRHTSGSISTVQFRASIIADSVSECEEVHIMHSFKKKGIDQLRLLDGVSVKIE